jgi:LacI family transcriptional regulator
MDPAPTAIFVAFDALAYRLCAALEGAGVRIPADMSVIGFDWIARFEDPASDLLSSAAQDFESFGLNAADLLLDRVVDGLAGPPRQILLPAPVVARMSTGVAHASRSPESGVFGTELRARMYR